MGKLQENGNKFEPSIRTVCWADVRNEVAKINPQLFDIIEEIAPDASFRLYLGEYPFGELIVKEGKYCVPIMGHGMCPIDSSHVPQQVKDDLLYNDGANPASLILDKSIEIFIDHPANESLNLFGFVPSGGIISISRILRKPVPNHPPLIWNVSSGSRSLFMLPKISQQRKYKKMQRSLGIDINIPKNMTEHWQTFKSIYRHENINAWKTRTLMFSKKWVDHLDDPAWIKFKAYLLEKYVGFGDTFGNLLIWDIVFSLILKESDSKPPMYVRNTVRQLFQLGAGFIPGFAPAQDDSKAPISELQNMFIEHYKLDNGSPIIMVPTYFDLYNNSPPIYYSLQFPTLLEDVPKPKDNSSVISETYDIAKLYQRYMYTLMHKEFNIDRTVFNDVIRKTAIQGFHLDPGPYSETIKSVDDIIKKDNRFIYKDDNFDNLAINSSFFKGCFRICKKPE